MSIHAESQETKSPESELLSLLDRIRHFRYALVGISIVLSIDIAFALFPSLGFAEMSWLNLNSSAAFGAAVLCVVGYLFFMSGLSPLVQGVLEKALEAANIPELWNRHRSNWLAPPTWERMYRHGYARLRTRKELALLQKDAFWIQRIAEHEAQVNASKKERDFMASMSFSCMLLLLVDALFLNSTAWSHAAVTDVFSSFGAAGRVVVVLVLAWLVVTPWWNRLLYAQRIADGDDWIADPESAKKALEDASAERKANDPRQAIPLYRRGN